MQAFPASVVEQERARSEGVAGIPLGKDGPEIEAVCVKKVWKLPRQETVRLLLGVVLLECDLAPVCVPALYVSFCKAQERAPDKLAGLKNLMRGSWGGMKLERDVVGAKEGLNLQESKFGEH